MWGEEIIDRRILKCQRVVNERLSTIDYLVNNDNTSNNNEKKEKEKKKNILIFRTCELEKKKVIFQLGTNCPERALEAARMIEHDVAGVDINMGCPKVMKLFLCLYL